MIFGKPGIVAKSRRFFNGKVAYSQGVRQFLEFPAQLPHNRTASDKRDRLPACRISSSSYTDRLNKTSDFDYFHSFEPLTGIFATMSEHRSRLDFALKISFDAAEIILSHYQSQTLGIESKADDSPVTVADKGAEQLIRAALAKEFPNDGILGEEFDDVASSNGYRWVLDPIDGTKPFIYGVPLFGTLIGIEFEGRMVAGVCRLPALNEVMYAVEGEGAWWQIGDGEPTRARVSEETDLSKARLMFTEPTSDIRCGRGQVLPKFLQEVRIARGWGDCYGHMLVATGRADIAVDPQMSAWDIAALIPIVREAGGSCTDWKGDENIIGGDGVSVTPALKDAVFELLKDAPPIRNS